MFQEIEREKLENMPYDMLFANSRGEWELCHSTGYMVKFENDPVFWKEFIDSEGHLHYGN